MNYYKFRIELSEWGWSVVRNKDNEEIGVYETWEEALAAAKEEAFE